MKEETKNIDLSLVGKESLIYHPSKVSWSISEHIAKENPIIERIALYTICYMLIMALAYSLIAKVAISIDTSGVLEYESANSSVVTKNDMTIDKILAKSNQEVLQGDIVLIAKDQLTDSSLDVLRTTQKEVMKLLIADEKGSCDSACQSELERSAKSTFAFESNLTTNGLFKEYLLTLTREFSAYTNALQTRKSTSLTTEGLRFEIKQIRQKIRNIEQRKSQNVLRMEYTQLKTQLANLQSQLKERISSSESQIGQSRANFKITLSDMPTKISDYIKSHQVVAPTGGVLVFFEKIAPEQFLPARTKLFQIIPVGDELIGKALISNKDISKVQEGSKTKISIDALPEREYESVWGEVVSVSVDPKEDPKTQELKYEIVMLLDRQSLQSFNEQEQQFKLGMSFQAKIITGYRSLFRVGVTKLLNIKDKYIGDVF